MKHIPIFSTIIMIAGFAFAIHISANKLTPLRADINKNVPGQMNNVFVPKMGLGKFLSNIQLIRLIQEEGAASYSKNTKKKSSEPLSYVNEKRGELYFQAFDSMTDLNPNNDKFYTFGAMLISHDAPERAIELLEKGDKLCATKNWKRANLCHYIQDSVISARETDPVKKKAYLKKTISYLKESMECGDADDFVERQWLRKNALDKGLENNALGKLNLWFNYYKGKINALTSETGETSGASGEKGNLLSLSGTSGDASTQKLRQNIIAMAQEMALTNWKESKKSPDAEMKDRLTKHMARIVQVYSKISGETHYSPISLKPYGPGERFDVTTGTPVKVYGICKACESQGKDVITKGSFCYKCGTKVAR